MPITFLVPGEADSAASAGTAAPAQRGATTLKQSVRVAQRRDAGQMVPVQAEPGQDVVVLQLANGPELVLHPETARELFAAQAGASSRGGAAAGTAPDQVAVPVRLQWPQRAPDETQQRGIVGDVLLAGLQVVQRPLVEATGAAIVAKFDGAVKQGVHRLDAAQLFPTGGGTPLAQVPAPAAGGRLLVLIHGTFSSTQGTYQRLWTEHPELVQSLFAHYGADNVYALEHATLGKSPVENALELVKTLPDGAVLHLLTHSRGGLVAEVLARACAQQQGTEDDFAALAADPVSQAALRALFEELRTRRVRVERIVRVACPARGTLLASKRLDAYLSVLRWGLQLAKLPVVPELLEFLGEVARLRLDPMQIPGLAAQVPDSALVQWIHRVQQPIAGELRVIAGDMAADSLGSWLKTLVSDSFFWTDNDLVVQTRSMYGGAPRAQDAAFVLDAGGTVSHFSYFGNALTAQAVADALLKDTPPGFQPIGPLSWAGQSSTGLRAAPEAAARGPQPERPALVLLPGIVGSNLRVGNARIWLSWRLVNGFLQLAYNPAGDDVEPDGPIAAAYEGLMGYLGQTHEVIAFDFDWRLPIEQEAKRLAGVLLAAVHARAATGQPVRVLAHSMGGLVTRVMQLEAPEAWSAWMAHPGARLLMLGTPNGGSWAPMQVLTGDDTLGNAIGAFGAPFRDHEARSAMAGFPGLLQMQQGLLDPDLKLDQAATWAALARQDEEAAQRASIWHSDGLQITTVRWGLPAQPLLDAAVQLRKRLDKQRDEVLPQFADRMCMVLGRARATPDGIAMGDNGLEYDDLIGQGDGRVTDRSAMLPGVPAWVARSAHGSLPSFEDAWPAYLELLTTGKTQRLPVAPVPAPVRGMASMATAAAQHERSRPARLTAGMPPGRPDPMRAPAPSRAGRTEDARLRITVHNSDLGFVREPLLIGHYASLALTGSEAAVDRLLGGKLSRSLRAGDYPQEAGRTKVFANTRLRDDNPWQLPRPESVVVTGLGPEGKLQPDALVKAVANGVVAWALALDDRPDPPASLEMAATLLGSGGVNITPGQAAQLIARGVREANRRLRAVTDGGAGGPEARPLPLVTRLLLVDLYLDRASEAWRALRELEAAVPDDYEVDERIESADSGMERPPESSYRGAEFDLVIATWTGTGTDSRLTYRMDTRRARSELQAQAAQTQLLEQLLRSGARDGYTDALGRTLFQLLVPIDLAPFMAGGNDTQIELNDEAAKIPWEMLDAGDGSDDGEDEGSTAAAREPWAIRTRLLRKLQTTDFRLQTQDATRLAGVLVIGEPDCSPARGYPRLPGARREARAVQTLLDNAGLAGGVQPLIAPEGGPFGPSSVQVIQALLAKPWRVIHICGHGAEPTADNPRGVVLSNGVFLGPREIQSMRTVPELVFVNCCYSGAPGDPAFADTDKPLNYSRPAFAANVATALIRIGVKCVVATGWAVDDAAAEQFASAFYGTLLRGGRFIDAVADARRAARAVASGAATWGAYQCYGDPDWRLVADMPDAQRPAAALPTALPTVASASGLVQALQALATRANYQGANGEGPRRTVENLEQRFASAWGRRGDVAEAFGLAWEALNDMGQAIRWFEAAATARDGRASYKSTERLHNLQARLAWETLQRSLAEAGGDAGARRKLKGPAADAIATMEAAREGLRRLAAIAPTSERISLLGSVEKRLAMAHCVLDEPARVQHSVQEMLAQYQRAWDAAAPLPDAEGFYPAMNVLAAHMALGDTPPADVVAQVQALVAAKGRSDPDFWSVAAAIELEAWGAIARRELAAQLDRIRQQLDDLHDRVAARVQWQSVHDQTQFVVMALRRLGTLQGDEDAAAQALLDMLAVFAFGTPHSARAAKPAARKPRATANKG